MSRSATTCQAEALSSTATPSEGPSRARFFNRRLANTSVLSLASITSFLPQYSAVDSETNRPPDFDEPTSPLPSDVSEDHLDAASSSPSEPSSPPQRLPVASYFPDSARVSPTYSYLNPRHSTILGPSSSVERHSVQPHEFEYAFPIRSNKPWATLHLFTRDSIPGNLNPSTSQPRTPRFWGGHPITGMLQLDLENPQTIQQITITVKGKIITSAFEGGTHLFFSHEYMLWNKQSGDPRRPTANEGNPKGKFDGRFLGEYTIPFSLPFPTHVDLSARAAAFQSVTPSTPSSPATEPVVSQSASPNPFKRRHTRPWSFSFASPSRMPAESDAGTSEKQNRRRSTLPRPSEASNSSEGKAASIAYPMPPSFAENRVAANVVYELAAHVVHGRFRPDSKLKTNIAYMPALVPLPASLRRQMAYESGGVLPGPISDPSGWFALQKTTIQGEFGPSSRNVNVYCALYVANPLSYTRGTVVPCYLTLSSDDASALEALSSPKTPCVRLTRKLRHFVPHGGGESALTSEDHKQNVIGNGTGPSGLDLPTQLFIPSIGVMGGSSWQGNDLNLRTVVHEMASAVWWVPPKDVQQQTYIRHLEGEIHLAGDLQPSGACSIFSVEYFVELLPPSSSRFEPFLPSGARGRPKKQILVSHPVEITTLHRPGEPAPAAFSEPPKTKIRSLTIHTINEEQEA